MGFAGSSSGKKNPPAPEDPGSEESEKGMKSMDRRSPVAPLDIMVN